MPSVAVIDVETTGLNPYRHDRIVELAALVVSPDGTILREFETLVNPERDIGPTHVHGLTAGDVLHAPRFGQVAGELVEVLSGCVAIAGHHVRFDRSFLEAEFVRIGYTFPECRLLCTRHLAGGGSLLRACSDYGIPAETEAHVARNDARATTQLLLLLLRDAPHLVGEMSCWPAIDWPSIQKDPVKTLTREDSRRRAEEPPGYLQALLSRVQPDIPADSESAAIFEYAALLDRVIEDRHIDDSEGQGLYDLAERWAITSEQIRKANEDYLLRLSRAAWADGVVTESERRDLQRVASLLGIDTRAFEEILGIASQKPIDVQPQLSTVVEELDWEEFAGKQVCFTGECQCRLNREVITRDVATQLAVSCGMVVKESVTKKLDMLVVADPDTQSGKAKKARQYGIRIVHERVFWRVLGLEVE